LPQQLAVVVVALITPQITELLGVQAAAVHLLQQAVRVRQGKGLQVAVVLAQVAAVAVLVLLVEFLLRVLEQLVAMVAQGRLVQLQAHL
jgi:hypothetical protein